MAVGEEIVLAGWVPAEAEAVPVAGKSWEYQRDRVAGWSLSVIVLSMVDSVILSEDDERT